MAIIKRTLLEGISLLPSMAAVQSRLPSFIHDTSFKTSTLDAMISEAVTNGFRGFDISRISRRSAKAGEGLRAVYAEGAVSRGDLFIQANVKAPRRLTFDLATLKDLRLSIEKTLDHLRVDEGAAASGTYLDSLLLELPLHSTSDMLSAWSVLEDFVPDTVKDLGVTHATLAQVKLLNGEAKIRPKFVKNLFTRDVEYDRDLRRWCKTNDIIYQAHMPLSYNQRLINTRPITFLCNKLDVKPAAALFCFILALDWNTSVVNGLSVPMQDDAKDMQTIEEWAAADENQYEWENQLKHFKDLVGENYFRRTIREFTDKTGNSGPVKGDI